MNPKSTLPLKTIRDFIRYATTRLYNSEASFNHGYDNPVDEASFLVLRSLNIPLEYEEKFLEAKLTDDEREMILNNISRRCDELEPTAYITKEWWLTGFCFYVDDRALIPRSFIAELIKDHFGHLLKTTPRSILDMCTGSGCLAILLSMEFPGATVDAVDISQGALDVAQINISNYGLDGIVIPIRSDLFENLGSMKYDLIICNPPYVTEESMENLPGEYRHEPSLALAAGSDGMDVIKLLMKHAREHLNDGGLLVVELGDGAEAFKENFPQFPVQWLPCSGGPDQVFAITKESLP